MAEHIESHDKEHSEDHGPMHYVKVWAILLVLFLISVAGPELSHHRAVILITAFGIAIVKAYLVAVKFMHINHEKKYIAYIMFAMLGAVFLFYIAVSTDVEKTSGNNWENASAKAVIEQNQGFEKHIEHE